MFGDCRLGTVPSKGEEEKRRGNSLFDIEMRIKLQLDHHD
jgi:hypothetical protein